MIKLPLPIQGINKGLLVASVPTTYTTNMNNVRPTDVLETRIRMGQRPGLVKFSDTLAGGSNQPVVWITSVSSIS